MTAQNAAKAIKKWAISAGLLDDSYKDPAPQITHAVEIGLQGFVDNAAAFRRRGIAFVAYNDKAPNVTVFTHKKLSKKEQKDLPAVIAGVPIQYRQGGLGHNTPCPPKPFAAGSYATHNDRYTCGSSVGIGNHIGGGTLGCLVTDGHRMYGMSNNHVTGNCNFTEPLFPIVAPALCDLRPGHLDPFTIGHHERVATFRDGIPENVDISGNSDAAIFRIRDASVVSSMQRGFYDTPVSVTDPEPGMAVEKVGRTSIRTTGVIAGAAAGAERISYTVQGLGQKVVYFNNLFIVVGTPSSNNKFSLPGDSGSLVTVEVDGQRHAIGLVVAGNEQMGLSFVLPLRPVLEELGVTLVSGHNI